MKELSFRTMHKDTKFSLTANISRLNKSRIWKKSFFDHFGSFILLENKSINKCYKNNKK